MVLLNNLTFNNNTALRSGGAVYWNGLYGDILYCRFDDNHAIGNVTAHDRPDVAAYSNEGVMVVLLSGQVHMVKFIFHLCK